MNAPSPWEWHPHPEVWLLVGGLLWGYFFALRRLGPRYVPAGQEAATRSQKVMWVLGVLTLWIGADYPIHEIAERYLFSVHMGQHTLFSLVAPPLLIMGTPNWLARLLLSPPGLMRVMRMMTRPVVALLVFNAVIAVTHWPYLVNLSMRSEPAHFALHTVLFTTSVWMWWPVVGRLPELARLSDLAKMGYLFLQSIVPTVPASFLTFADGVIYKGYELAPRIGIDAVTDQRVAGLLMKIGGGLLLWTVIAIVFFRWYSREQSEQVDDISWDDFERSLEAWELRR